MFGLALARESSTNAATEVRSYSGVAPDTEWYSVAFHPAGERIAMGGQAGTVLVRDMATGEVTVTLEDHHQRVVGRHRAAWGQR